MDGSNPEHYPIADFLNWHKNNELVLNPDFQRGSIWLAPARSYLIDSILRGYPIPKLLLRTKIDRNTRKTIRDVVDGQQRLRTIIDFVDDKLVLGVKASEFRGMRFGDLEPEQQDKFLAYKLTTEQLINASDEDVLEVFVRINSYTVPVNEPELRNARYINEFSSVVKSTVVRVKPLWELGVISERSRVRMLDQSLIADIYGFFINGIGDSDEKTIDRLYRQMSMKDASVPDSQTVEDIILEAVGLLAPFQGQRIVQRPHFLMVLATLGYIRGHISQGRLSTNKAQIGASFAINREAATEELSRLNDALTSEDDEDFRDLEGFIEASRSSTQRIKSRQVRFDYFYDALVAGIDHNGAA